jgi:hypothetical protein
MDGLQNLDSIGGVLHIADNNLLTNMSGWESLKSIEGDLLVSDNDSMLNLSGMDSLSYLGGELAIMDNLSLQSLSGIDNIEEGSIIDLLIIGNHQLTHCAVEGICTYILNPSGVTWISVNATGCNSVEEVEEVCTVGVPELPKSIGLSIYPNPFTTSTTIEYERYEPTHVHLTIYNAIGEAIHMAEERLMPEGKHTFTWSPESLPGGLYYGVLRSRDGVSVVKMVKQ